MSDEQKRSFISAITMAVNSALEECEDASLFCAWAAFESNWGTTTGFLKALNPWNVVAGSHWHGPTVQGPDTDGQGQPIQQQWRHYSSFTAAAQDVISLIKQPRFGSAFQLLLIGDPHFVLPLATGGYFTLDPQKYLNGVLLCLADVQRLNVLPDLDKTPTEGVGNAGPTT